ncbi:MAG: hypothetical protein MMC23_004010 [Stictis urceolatum]|nr:hypothetical protein [Stictis urceolata]
MIRELAEYEKELSSVQATEQTLLSTLSFPSDPSKGYAKTLLLFAPSPPSSSSTSAIKGKALPLAPPLDDPSSSSSPTPSHSAKPAGMALYFPNYSTWRSAPGTYLEDLFVRPEFRKRGYGKQLLRALARETLAIGGGRLDWSVLKWNAPSIEFYMSEAVGAQRMEEWVGMRVEGEALGKLAGEGA